MKNRIREAVQRFKGSCDYLEIRIESWESLVFSVMNREIKTIRNNHDLGCAIRACYKGGWGFASINTLDSLERFVERVINQARTIGQEKTLLAEAKTQELDFVDELINDPDNVPLEKKIDLFVDYSDQILSHDPLIKNSYCSYSETKKHKLVCTSEGTLLDLKNMDLFYSLSAEASTDGVSQLLSHSNGSSNDVTIVNHQDKAVEQMCVKLIDLVKAPKVQGGKLPVIVDPILGGIFIHEAFGHHSEADEFIDNDQYKKTFPLGLKIGSDNLTVYDTGLDKGTRGYVPFDDEGVPGQKTVLIDNGILAGRLHNRESAAKFGELPTGNARAVDYRYPPICRMRNTCIANGTASFDELLEDIDLGVYAVDASGGMGGEMFSFNANYGYMIRKGKLAELVRDVSISGNLFKTLLNIDRIGNDFLVKDMSGGCGKLPQYPLPVTSSSPHFRISEAAVGGA